MVDGRSTALESTHDAPSPHDGVCGTRGRRELSDMNDTTT
jgi:hypothetical protein